MLNNTDRSALTSLSVHLEPGADASVLTAFVAANREACLGELGAAPGVDQLRAVLIRVFADEPELLGPARDAIADYPEQIAESGRSLLLRRHPAWVGLCRLELDGGVEADASVIDEAIELANTGFAAAAEPGEIGRGEALWAMSEQAEVARWTDRAEWLLELAGEADFADPAHRAQVRFLLAMQRAQAGVDGADALFRAVTADDDAPVPSRVHAAWILAHREPSEGPRHWIEAALTWLEDDEDPDVRARLQAALDELDAST